MGYRLCAALADPHLSLSPPTSPLDHVLSWSPSFLILPSFPAAHCNRRLLVSQCSRIGVNARLQLRRCKLIQPCIAPNIFHAAYPTHSSYLDFPALYTQECSQDGAYLCSDRYRCSVSISSSLIKAFPEIFDKHRGVKASSTCTWNPFPVEAPYVEKSACAYKITSNKCVPVTSAQTSSPQGYCALVGMKSGEIMKNPMYDSRNCPMAATTLSDGKLTGFFESSSANTGCRNADDCNCISTNSGECAATPGSGPCTGTGSRNFNVQAFSSSNTGNVSETRVPLLGQ